jgi:hypothetical protein
MRMQQSFGFSFPKIIRMVIAMYQHFMNLVAMTKALLIFCPCLSLIHRIDVYLLVCPFQISSLIGVLFSVALVCLLCMFVPND